MKKIFMIDGHALVFRAYYAFIRRPMINSKGINTSAIFGFCKTLFELILREKPSHLFVAFDPGGKNFRHEKYPLYKANRETTPEIIKTSIPVIRDFLNACSIPVIVKEGVEADDVIGSLAKKAEEKQFEVYMVTPDKDYGQLVSKSIKIYKPSRGGNGWEILGVPEICAQYGISDPLQVIDILSIWGDASDNIPGIPGIGEMGAKRLIGNYKSIENIYAHLAELSAKNQERFRDNKETLMLAKDLVTIRTHLDLPLDEDSCLIRTSSMHRLRTLFREYEFNSLLRMLPLLEERFGCIDAGCATLEPEKIKTIEPFSEFVVIDTLNELARLHAQAIKNGLLAFRALASHTEFMRARLEGMAIFTPGYPPAWIRNETILHALKSLLEDHAVSKIGYHMKESIGLFKRMGIVLKGKVWDTELMHYLLNPEQNHHLDAICSSLIDHLPVKPPTQNNLFDTGETRNAHILTALEEARNCMLLQPILHHELENASMLNLYTDIEMPVMYILADMEYEGIRLDVPRLQHYSVQLNREADEIEARIRAYAQEPGLNISSPKQLGIVLYEKLRLDNGKKRTNANKQYPTDEETLNYLIDRHPIVPLILEYRSLRKLINSYTETLPRIVLPETGKIHTTFNQTVTATGRLSAKNPNLQNIPVRDARGREIRRAFVPSKENHLLMSADYSQIELRLMAHISEDPNLIAAFAAHEDIHRATAARIFHCPLQAVSAEQRSRAKTANFGIIYGISAFGLSQRLHIPRSEARELIEQYYLHYPKVKEYLERTIAFAKEHGYVETLLHRKRYTPEINSRNAIVRALTERNAINAPIQGSAADLIKLAMVNVQNELSSRHLQSRMILQVHDELVFDFPLDERETLQDIVKYQMEHAMELKVNLEVSIGIGANWMEAH